MTTCAVRWRPSGGRGEFEFVPADALDGREITLDFSALGTRIPAEVRGERAQGKPRLRKHEPWNRQKLHLPQLVMAVACLPTPRREDADDAVAFPLRSGRFLIDEMTFGIASDDGARVVLSPLKVTVLHTDFEFDLEATIRALGDIEEANPRLAAALAAHRKAVRRGINTTEIRTAADEVIRRKTELFGTTNAGSVRALLDVAAMPAVEAEEIAGQEGRLLTRLHTYRERDSSFSRRVRDYYRRRDKGRLTCQACGTTPRETYGDAGDQAMEAHHKVAIEELQPDSVVRVEDMVMLCANCHRVVHSRKPCLTVEQMRALLRPS